MAANGHAAGKRSFRSLRGKSKELSPKPATGG